ncbi:MAG: succinate dehydrogenase assembly factor 2 [Gammaproteobacteria bacterium]|nr:succinate dehydrogenase assembly factor 2 [Gammaproteobacteria bacterium]
MTELSRLRWLCRRGMKELDLVMSGYLERYYLAASNEDQALFRALLDMPDPDLFGLLLGHSESDDPELERFIKILRGMSGRH